MSKYPFKVAAQVRDVSLGSTHIADISPTGAAASGQEFQVATVLVAAEVVGEIGCASEVGDSVLAGFGASLQPASNVVRTARNTRCEATDLRDFMGFLTFLLGTHIAERCNKGPSKPQLAKKKSVSNSHLLCLNVDRA